MRQLIDLDVPYCEHGDTIRPVNREVPHGVGSEHLVKRAATNDHDVIVGQFSLGTMIPDQGFFEWRG